MNGDEESETRRMEKPVVQGRVRKTGVSSVKDLITSFRNLERAASGSLHRVGVEENSSDTSLRARNQNSCEVDRMVRGERRKVTPGVEEGSRALGRNQARNQSLCQSRGKNTGVGEVLL